ncbi:GntR family transcriptional regulator, partial [Sphingobium sp. AN641]|uniref:GntR family transcriptional regulator n=1 Tax=Sphingobium sp. AN641 TaxID=3133443 RepID=UPI0030C270CC
MSEPNSALPSLTQDAYQRLRALLLFGRVAPGAKLKITDLITSLDVNMSAVREALARLTAEGLVIAEPQKGFRASLLTEVDLRQLTDARIPIEEMCIRRAIDAGDLAWEQAIVSALHGLTRTQHYGEDGRVTSEWAEAHDQLHRAFVSACDNPWLLRMRETLAAQGDRYRWFAAAASRPDRDLDDEHRCIADAFIDRDADRAVRLMSEHIRFTAETLLKHGFFKTSTRTASPIKRQR